MESDSEDTASVSGSSNVDSEDEYDMCCIKGGTCDLPFDPTSLENIILTLSDKFNFRILMNSGRVKNALLVTSGLSLAGSLIGKHYGGKIGAAVGGAVGGACGIGIVVVSMRDVWLDIKGKLGELFDIVYDYLAGLGMDDYVKATKFLIQHKGDSIQLAMIIIQVTSDILGKKILSSLTAA